ncbi:MAG: hypothetical protein OXU20_12560 [Myxococcales bacterium]|nr:hypothetical protein [Myxococcales bacterium]MDD9968914.1 hypothetical protein [Myxococcales bacterium]
MGAALRVLVAAALRLAPLLAELAGLGASAEAVDAAPRDSLPGALGPANCAETATGQDAEYAQASVSVDTPTHTVAAADLDRNPFITDKPRMR